MAFYPSEKGAKLVELARYSIETFINKSPLNLDKYKEFSDNYGVFVTIKKDGEIRGQMGFLETSDPLHMAVVKAARDAAFRDKSHPALQAEELDEIEVEVTITSKPILIRAFTPDDYLNQIHLGYDGLMIKAGVYSAIMLPQSIGTDWDTERMLRQLCISAGLTMDSWRDMIPQIFRFNVQVFAERAGKVVEIL